MNIYYIHISKLNEVFVKINCDKGVAQELHSYFSFRVPGYQFVPAYKNKLWDGLIKLFSLKDFTIYHGLVPYIEKFCQERNYKLEIDSDVISTEVLSVIEAESFIKTLNLPHKVRDYQLKSFIYAIRNKRILLLSPTASGKSLILYMIVRKIQDMDFKKGLLIVPTTSLCYQMFNDFKDYSKNDPNFNVDDEISIIMAGKDKNPKVNRIKITLDNGNVVYFKPNDEIKTKDGKKLAKNLTIDDDLL